MFVRMIWEKQKYKVFLDGVQLKQPYQYKSGTKQRFKVWQSITENLQIIYSMEVDGRDVRDYVQSKGQKLRGVGR